MYKTKNIEIEILRVVTQPKHPTRGVLIFNQDIIGTTLELPWEGNIRKVSCIPLGLYECKRVYDRKTSGGLFIPTTFEVMDVPNRDGILFHIGNTVNDTQGCILIGLGFGIIEKKRAILNSKLGFDMFLDSVRGVNEFTLRIRDDEYQAKC